MDRRSARLGLAVMLACGCGGITTAGAGDAAVDSSVGADTSLAADATSTFDGGAPDSGGSLDSGTLDGTTLKDGGISLRCPLAPPAQGTACLSVQAGVGCEYGASFYADCDVVMDCDATTLTWTTRYNGQCPWGAPSSTCPAAFSSITPDGTCTLDQTNCDYAEGHCECISGCGGPPPPPDAGFGTRWRCDQPAAGCPAARPRLGADCTTEGLQCSYGICCISTDLTCHNGYWSGVYQGAGCP
jgi:hypothetical protein